MSRDRELKHFPQNIKSRQAWLGHEFTIGEFQNIPTKSVSKTQLMKHVGRQVTIDGIWNPGKEWKPSDHDELLANPLIEGENKVVRGSGIEAQGLTLQKPE